jgi:hypothetical protein
MELHIKFVSLTCSFTGDNPPKPGQTYVDANGTEWSIRDGVKRDTVLSDQLVWNVPIGTTTLRKGLPMPLVLKRKYSAQDIRNARQQLQDIGCTEVTVGTENDCLFVDGDKFEHLQIPEEIDGIPVVVNSVDLNRKLERQIVELIHWRENSSDRYGADLLSLVLADLSDPNHMSEKRVPLHLRRALKTFRSLPYIKQRNMVFEHVDAGPRSMGEPDNYRDPLPEE